MPNKNKPKFNLPLDYLAHQAESGRRGGKKNSPRQRKQRKAAALAMLRKRLPYDPRWKQP